MPDNKSFVNAPYSRRIEKPWGFEIHWVPEGMPYMGKLLHINAKARISLQYHDEKRESWFLISGQAVIIWENSEGKLIETEMQSNVGYTIAPGQKHRLVGVTDCDVIEVSTPEIGKTFRVEDDYNRAGRTEDAAEREKRNRGEI